MVVMLGIRRWEWMVLRSRLLCLGGERERGRLVRRERGMIPSRWGTAMETRKMNALVEKLQLGLRREFSRCELFLYSPMIF